MLVRGVFSRRETAAAWPAAEGGRVTTTIAEFHARAWASMRESEFRPAAGSLSHGLATLILVGEDRRNSITNRSNGSEVTTSTVARRERRRRQSL
jgi:hypothetical protein